MQSEVASLRPGADIIESVITKGDLAKLTAEEKVLYYKNVCDSVGLNPLTRPFEYINLSGRLTLYARRDAADQLRKIHGISVEVVSQKISDDFVTVHVRACDKTGRTDEDFGVVAIAGAKGEARANAVLKAITKAKRRVTLSIAGLGFLDEMEVEEIPHRERSAPTTDTAATLDQFAADDAPTTIIDTPQRDYDLIADARNYAAQGTAAFTAFWQRLPKSQREEIRAHLAEFERTAKTADDPFGLPPLEPQGQSVAAAAPPRSSIWADASYLVAPQTMLDGTPNWSGWQSNIAFLVNEAAALTEIEKLQHDNREFFSALRKSKGDLYRALQDTIAARRMELAEEPPA